MNTTPRADPGEARLATYLAGIAAGLHGPRRRREQILAELRDGLDHAVADHAAAGLPPEQAVTAAIDQFGKPHAVAEAFAAELATAYARRTLAWFIGTGPLVGIWWLLLLHPRPWQTGLVALLAAIPVIPLIVVAIVTAAATFATTGRLMLWFPEAGPRRVLAATVAVAALAFTGDTVVIGIYAWSDLPMRPLAVIALAASVTRIACSLVTVRQATTARSRIPAATQRTISPAQRLPRPRPSGPATL
jgi:hypothetical protein